MNPSEIFLSEITVKQFIEIVTFIDVFLFLCLASFSFLLYEFCSLLKFLFSKLTIKRAVDN